MMEPAAVTEPSLSVRGRIGASCRIIVTGGSGFIGSHLVRTLARLGHCVRILDSVPFSDSTLRTVEYRCVDITVLDDVMAAIDVADIVFHLAGNSSTTNSIRDPIGDLRLNAVGLLTVLEASRRRRVRGFVYLSSASVYGTPLETPIREEHPTDPIFPYGASKLAGEHYCKVYYTTYQTSVIIARPFCVYGPGEKENALVEVSRYMRWYLACNSIPIVGDAELKSRDFVYVDDVVSALIILADRGQSGHAYNIGSGTETSMRQLAIEIGKLYGREVSLTQDRSMLRDSYRLAAHIGKISSLGYISRTSLSDGIAKVADYLGSSPSPPDHPTVLHIEHLGER